MKRNSEKSINFKNYHRYLINNAINYILNLNSLNHEHLIKL